MTSPNDLDQLSRIGKELAAQEGWRSLSSYYENRGKGLRTMALAALSSFVAEAIGWTFEERLRATRWIVDRRWKALDDNLLLPQPLLTELVSPTLWEWVERDPHVQTLIISQR